MDDTADLVALDRAALLAGLADAAGDGADLAAAAVVRAPGRVNLIGEHTDYNAGLVMPVAIDLEIRLAFVACHDREVRVRLLADGREGSFDLDAIGPARHDWTDYLAGTALELGRAGQAPAAFTGVLASTLPQGAGLSSSAALELAAAWAFAGPGGPRLAPLDLARVCQRAENGYVGVRSGLMDQFAAAHGVAGAALLFDCRDLTWREIPLPLATHELVVIHSGMPHQLAAGSAYNDRRAECERAVAALARVDPGVRTLRDVDTGLLARARPQLDEVAFRRARHVVTENARVLATAQAFAAQDLAAVGELWAAGHASLRDDFEVSTPELDALVGLATATPGVAAARMTGGGFGGSTINLVARDALPGLRATIARGYGALTGLEARLIPIEPVAGTGWLAA
ncbi:MAG TPA: galactokinase [Candidatus Sulfotelmatobacter sp.]|nr:galactokinase [Candidatus Sulfotelmatobacter sp.]